MHRNFSDRANPPHMERLMVTNYPQVRYSLETLNPRGRESSHGLDNRIGGAFDQCPEDPPFLPA